jgi:hypothetical protein
LWSAVEVEEFHIQGSSWAARRQQYWCMNHVIGGSGRMIFEKERAGEIRGEAIV